MELLQRLHASVADLGEADFSYVAEKEQPLVDLRGDLRGERPRLLSIDGDGRDLAARSGRRCAERQPEQRAFKRLGEIAAEEPDVRRELVAEFFEHVDLQEAELDPWLHNGRAHTLQMAHVRVQE